MEIIILEYDNENKLLSLKNLETDELHFKTKLDFFVGLYDMTKYYIDNLYENTLALQKTEIFLKTLKGKGGFIKYLKMDGSIIDNWEQYTLEVFIPNNKIKNIKDYKKYIDEKKLENRKGKNN